MADFCFGTARRGVSHLTAVIGWLVVAFPLLVFPEVVWPWGRHVVVVFAVVSLAVASKVATGLGSVRYLVAGLSLAILIGWAIAADRQTVLTHFSGAALGLLLMVTVALYGRTSARLVQTATIFLLLGFSALAVGLTGTQELTNKMVFLELIQQLPVLSVYVPGLNSAGIVNANALGGTALLVVPLGTALMLLPFHEGHRYIGCRVLGLLTTALGVLIVIATQSRAVWMAAWLMVLVGSARLPPPGKWRLLGPVVVFVIPMMLLVLPSESVIIDRFDRPIDRFVNSSGGAEPLAGDTTTLGRVLRAGQRSISDRSHIWGQGVDHVRSSPWFGIGLNEFRHVAQPPPGGNPQAHAHNIFLQLALDIGFLGLLVYMSLLAYLLVRADQAAHGPDVTVLRIGAAAGLSVAAAHFFGIGDAIALGARVGFFQWFASGLVLAAWRIQMPTTT